MLHLERIAAGIASLTTPITYFTIYSSVTQVRWGFWLSMVAIYLAPMNILFETVSDPPKGQKWPWWAWALAISIVVAWLRVLFILLSS